MSSDLTTIWELTRGQRRRYLAAVVALVIGSCFMYLVPLVPQVVLDGVLADDPEHASAWTTRVVDLAGGAEALRDRLWVPAVCAVALTLIAGLFTYLRARFAAIASERIVRDVRDRLHDHLQHLPIAFFDRAETGDLVQRCTSDVETLRRFLANQVVEIGRALLMLAVPLPLMLALDKRMTLVSVSLVVPIVSFSLIYFRRVQRTFQELDESEGQLTTTIQENLTGIRVVRAFARQDFEKEKFGERNRTFRRLDYRMFRLIARYWAISDLMCMGQNALVVACGGYWLAAGTLNVGTFYFFLAAVNLFVWPIRMMGRILTELGKATVAIRRIGEILREPDEAAVAARALPDSGTSRAAAEAALARSERQARGAIEFDHVAFAYNGSRGALEDVSFAVRPGQTVALLGPSGAGKSTIVSLLLRFYDPQSGVVRLDGEDITTTPHAELRSRIAVVMQEPFLYSKTLEENIRLGRSGATEDEIIEAARSACVHDAILDFDKGYDTMVGERGVTLSGGQRQRVALARALLHQPEVLILDDALSAVDTGTETMILVALRRRRHRHTTLVIAHRLSTLMHADWIVVLDRGRVIQQGNHQTLVGAEGFYRRLWKLQSAIQAEGVEAPREASRA